MRTDRSRLRQSKGGRGWARADLLGGAKLEGEQEWEPERVCARATRECVRVCTVSLHML